MSILTLLANILMVGHSLVGPDLPGMTEAAIAAVGAPAAVEAQVINGASLRWNWDHAAEAEGVNARALLATGNTDVLVLTEAQPLASHLEWSDSRGAVADWARAAWAGNPVAQVFLYETWPSLNLAPGGGPAWRAQIASDLPGWQSLVAAASAARPEGAPQARLIPAGQAMGLLADALARGDIPGAVDIADFFHDDIHLSGRGHYFVALVQMAAITGQSPEGLPPRLTRVWRDRASIVSPEMAAALQSIAGQAVATQRAAEDAAPPPPPPQPSTAAMPVVVLPGITNPDLALGLAGIADWSVQQPFLDVMKTARPWIAHKPGEWGGWDYAQLQAAGHVDARGWPQSLPEGATGMSTLVLTDLPPEAGGLAGRYVLTWAGKADLRLEGRAQGQETGPGRIAFDFTPGPGAVILTLASIDPADPIRDLRLVREDRATRLDAGEIFNPDWLARLEGVQGLRFMDWMATNNATLARAEDRPFPGDFSYAPHGAPMEVMVALANTLEADPWFTVPHLAEDALVRAMAEVVQRELAPGLRASVEFSNEVWNWQFAQARWADEAALARWGVRDAWVQFAALRAAEVAEIWAGVFGAEAPARLTRVIGTQTGWIGLEDMILDAPLVVAEGLPAPRLAFDAYAVAGYFAAGLGVPDKVPVVKDWLAQSLADALARADAESLEAAAREAFVQLHWFDMAVALAAQELADGSVTGSQEDTLARLAGTVFPYHKAVADGAGLALVMYEGGSHVVGVGPMVDDPELTAFFTYLNYTPQMGALYDRLLADWRTVSDAPFNAFVDVENPTKWGSWGALRHLGDMNPRWARLAAGCSGC